MGDESWRTIANRYNRQFRKIGVLSEQQNHRCCYCGTTMVIPQGSHDFDRTDTATIEHVIPKIKGGEREYLNEVAACRLCNNLRSADDPIDFYEWRLRHLDETPAQLQKTMNRRRRTRFRKDKAAQKAAVHQARLTRAYQTPYICRLFLVAIRQTVDLLDHALARLSPRKYRRLIQVADETDRNRSGHKRRHRRPRHRHQDTVGDPDTSAAEPAGQAGL